MKKRFDYFPYLMSFPAVLVISIICFYPLFQGIYMSFTTTRLTEPDVMRFIGLDNFRRLLVDRQFWQALRFTIEYTLLSTLFAYLIGLGAALMMHRDLKMKSAVRAMLLVPWVVPAVVGTTSWQWILNDQMGVVNAVLQDIGLISEPILFLARIEWAPATVIAFCVWKTFPFMAVVILASLQSINSDIIEAATIDGAGSIQKFFRITLPMIKRESLLAIILMIMWNFNRMDFIFLMTRGGPINTTQVMSIYSYYTAFFRNSLGYASAISVAMIVIMSVFLIAYFRMRKDVTA